MKSDDRHELQKNELSQWLLQGVDFLQRSWLNICYAIVAALAVYVGVNWYLANKQNKLNEAWIEYNGASAPEHFETVISRYPGFEVVPYAKLRLADAKFSEAQRELMGQREKAIPALERAQTLYHDLSEDNSAPSMVRVQAQFGSAIALEAKGLLDEAKKELKSLVDRYQTNSRYQSIVAQANKRMEELSQPEAVAFYQKYTSYKPPAVSTDLPTKSDLKPLGDPSSSLNDLLNSQKTDNSPTKSDDKKADDKKSDKDAKTTTPPVKTPDKGPAKNDNIPPPPKVEDKKK